MSIYTDVTKVPGYNATQYEALVNNAETQGVDRARIDALLLSAVNDGKDFSQAVEQVISQIPNLKSPRNASLKFLGEWTGVPAPGTVIMALITEISAKNRQQNKELMWAQTEALVASINDQADTMKSMAWHQLAIGLVAAGTGIVGGAMGGGMTMGGAIMQGVTQGVGSARDFAGTMFQASMKSMEADQERMRATRDSLKDLNDGLKDLIQKSLSSADNIQQGRNQAMGRILV